MATLLFDLLDEREADDREKVFDIELLAERHAEATDWVRGRDDIVHLQLGFFGASTGAAAALVATARRTERVRAIVSRGGRPDLAETYLGLVEAPTLLIVGGNDEPVIEMNQRALDLLRCEKHLEISAACIGRRRARGRLGSSLLCIPSSESQCTSCSSSCSLRSPGVWLSAAPRPTGDG